MNTKLTMMTNNTSPELYRRLIDTIKSLIRCGNEALDYQDGSGKPILREAIWSAAKVIEEFPEQVPSPSIERVEELKKVNDRIMFLRIKSEKGGHVTEQELHQIEMSIFKVMDLLERVEPLPQEQEKDLGAEANAPIEHCCDALRSSAGNSIEQLKDFLYKKYKQLKLQSECAAENDREKLASSLQYLSMGLFEAALRAEKLINQGTETNEVGTERSNDATSELLHPATNTPTPPQEQNVEELAEDILQKHLGNEIFKFGQVNKIKAAIIEAASPSIVGGEDR